jgi:hypothetical protein
MMTPARVTPPRTGIALPVRALVISGRVHSQPSPSAPEAQHQGPRFAHVTMEISRWASIISAR